MTTQPSMRAIAGYEVLAELGRGAHSVVHRVRRAGSADEVAPEYALKVLDRPGGGSAAALVAFRREAALLAGVDHPGLPRIHEVGEAGDGRPYLVMDLVEGRSLETVLQEGPLPAGAVQRLATDLAGALAAVHRKGLVHRDLKPANVVLDPDGVARLIDFGLAGREGQAAAPAPSPGGAARDTHGSMAVGTLAYAAPEQTGMLKRPVDGRSDLYSLGVLLFTARAGRLPFPDGDVGELLRHHAVTPAPDLAEVVPGTPPQLAAAVARLLAKDPDDRYQDGEDLLGDLTPEGRAATSHRRRRERTDAPLAGRDRELAHLTGRWDRAADGQGGVAVVRGAAGAGKSRLAAEVVARAEAGGALALRGKSSPDDPVPMAPLRAAVTAFVAEVGQRSGDGREAGLRLLREAGGPVAGLLAGLTPALAVVLGEEGRRPEGGDQQDQYAVAVAEFLLALARGHGSLVLQLDDAQWLDPGSRRVLAALAPALPVTPLLVIATARDDEAGTAATDAALAALGSVVDPDLTLGPLDPAAVAAVVAAQLPGIDAGSRLARLIGVRSDGNAFVVHEYVRAVVDAGLLRPSWGTWLLDEDGLDALELPHDAIGLVLSRVRGLAPHTRALLTTAAAVGARFDADTLAAVQGIERERALGALAEAAGHRLIESRGVRRFAFVHDRVREAMLEDLTPQKAPGLHQRIAQALSRPAPRPAGTTPEPPSPERVYATAHHYLRGDGSDPAATLAACREAGRLALANHAPREAVEFLAPVAAAAPAGDDDLALLLGTALKGDGRFTEAAQWLERALAAAGDPFRRAAVLTLLADTHRSTWSTDEARAAVEEGLAVLGAPLPRGGLRLALSTLGMFLTAVLMQYTRIGFGTARDEQAERIRLIAGLHEVGSYVAVISMRTEAVIMHNLRVVHWVNRLGSGRQYALSTATYGFVCGNLGLARAARRAFARALADPAAQQPAVRATIAHYEGAAWFLGHHDDGERWRAGLAESGRWLEIAAFGDAVSSLHQDAVAQGDVVEAVRLLAAGQARIGAEEKSSFAFAAAQTPALQGRSGEASAELERLRLMVAGDDVLGLRVVRLVTTLLVLREQEDLGPAFDAAAEELASLGLDPKFMIRVHRYAHFDLAMARLAQARAAQPTERPARLAAARDAVRVLRSGRANRTLRTRELVARADLQVLEGAPDRALRTLARIPPVHRPDSPTLAFEAARVRARALGALGGRPEALRQGALAVAVAEENGWPHRARRAAAEFGVGLRGVPADLGPTTTSNGLERHRLRALEQVSAAASRVLDPGALVRITLDETIRILAADRAFLFLVVGDRLVPDIGRDAAGQDVPQLSGYSASLVERVRETGRHLVVTGTEEGAALGARSAVLHGLRSILVAPLCLEGRVLGVVYLDSQVAKGIFTEEDAALLTALTNHIATSLETARAAQLEISMRTAERERDLAQRLGASLQDMTEALEEAEVLLRLLRAARAVLRCDEAWLLTRDGERATLLGGGADVLGPGAAAPQPRSALCDAVSAAFLRRGRTVTGAEGAPPPVLRPVLAGVTSWVSVPLRSRSSDVGTLVLADRSGVRLEEELEVVQALVTQGMTAHDKAALFSQVRELAVADELTGIANRRHFFELAERDLARARRTGIACTAMMIDIDHFKTVNDTHGHQTGDDVIRTVAARLAARLRAGDVLGRYGGEEFALLVPDAGDLPLAERLRAAVSDTPVTTLSGPVRVTVSIGSAEFHPGDGDLTSLLARADQALYRAKQAGRNCVRADTP